MDKNKKRDYGNYILNNKDKILKKKRKRIVIKRSILCFLILLTIMITLGLTLPQFNVIGIKVSGLEFIEEGQILTEANIESGINIFKVNTEKIKEKLLENTYIEKVKISRSLPNKIDIKIEERKTAFYVESEQGIYVIDKDGRVLGIKENIEPTELVKLSGIPMENLVVGEFVQKEERGFQGAKVISDFIMEKGYLSIYPSMVIEVNNFVDYKLYINETYMKLGTSENMNEKLATAFSILSKPEFHNLKGYVDVSFQGNPVVYKEE